MYILHRRRKPAHTLITLGIILLVLGGIGFAAKQMLRTETSISSPPAAIVYTVTDKQPPPQTIATDQYSFKLPKDWESFRPSAGLISGAQAWRNTAGNKGGRILTVYRDAAIRNLGINRVLPVTIHEDGLEVAGTISGNCTEFTKPDTQQAAQGIVRAKWQNVDFVCDVGNYVRQVAGIAASGTTNAAVLTGPTTGRHSIFITYDDSDISPNYDILTTVIQSFRLK